MFSLVLIHTFLCAQELVWFDPLMAEKEVVEGQGWSGIEFNRLPDDAKAQVREPVWGLSRNAAGLLIRFASDAAEVHVKFKPGSRLSMPHMPSTGVTGLDLYARDDRGSWRWVRGKYRFSPEEVSYTFVVPNATGIHREYQLYLPLYNSLSALKVGVMKDDTFAFMSKREAAPIVVYGTSIAQGACASRPGMAWTNIVGRSLDVPMINLAFSGNGRLEPEVLDYVKQIDAAVFVLDCLPNLGPWGGFTEEVVKAKILAAVRTLKAAHPKMPVLLVEHAGYSDGWMDPDRKSAYTNLNEWAASCFQTLKDSGVKGLYLLSKEEMGLGNEDFVDGTHPTDLGMQHYADAYIKKLKEILQ